MELHQSLFELGLSERESVVYTTLLQIGEGSILDIAKNCTIKRPTIYTAVEALEAKGLVSRIKNGKRAQFRAESPEKLQMLLKMKERTLADILPQLLAIQNVPRGTKPEIRFYEGKEAIAKLYLATFSNLEAKDEIFFLTSIRDLRQSIPEILDISLNAAKKWKWNVKELTPENFSSREYIEKVKPSIPSYQTRFLPKGMDIFDMEVFFTQDLLCLVSLQKGIFAISIKSANFVESFRSVFKFLWSISRPANKETK